MTKTYLMTRWGGSEDDPGIEILKKAIDELDVSDQEHPDTWLTNTENGIVITLHEKGLIIISDEDQIEFKHIKSNDKLLKLEIWKHLINNNIAEINKINWINGHGIPPQTIEERQQIEETILKLEYDWFNKLLVDDIRICSIEGCKAKSTKYGLLCKRHCFEQKYKKECPY